MKKRNENNLRNLGIQDIQTKHTEIQVTEVFKMMFPPKSRLNFTGQKETWKKQKKIFKTQASNY